MKYAYKFAFCAIGVKFGSGVIDKIYGLEHTPGETLGMLVFLATYWILLAIQDNKETTP